MANLCMVSYRCEGKKEQLDELNGVLKQLKGNRIAVVENDWGNLWLGCIIERLGGDWHDYRCRGAVTDFGFEKDGTLFIEQATAWCEQEGFRGFLEQRFPEVVVFYRQLESSLGYFSTNDAEGRCFSERFALESHEGIHYFVTLEEAAEYVSDWLGARVVPDVEAICDALEEYSEVQGNADEGHCVFLRCDLI